MADMRSQFAVMVVTALGAAAVGFSVVVLGDQRGSVEGLAASMARQQEALGRIETTLDRLDASLREVESGVGRLEDWLAENGLK